MTSASLALVRTTRLSSFCIATLLATSACSTAAQPSAESATVSASTPNSGSPVATANAPSGAGSSPKSAPIDAARAAVEALRNALHANYSYRDRLGVDWNAAIDERKGELESAPDAIAFAKIASEILARAKDPHVSLAVDGQAQRLVPHPHQPVLNFALPTLQRVIVDWKVRTKCLVTGSFEGYAYVLITHWERARCGDDLGSDVAKALVDARGAKGLILDMRGNMGGDEMLARAVGGRFVKRPTPYAKHALVDATKPGSFGAVQERVLDPIEPGWELPVVTLMGPANLSSNEAFLLMMRAAGSRLIGQRSAGSSGNPQPHALGNGVTVYLPSWKAMLLDGSPIEGVGIAPDVEVQTKPGDFEKEDPVLRAAASELGKSARAGTQ